MSKLQGAPPQGGAERSDSDPGLLDVYRAGCAGLGILVDVRRGNCPFPNGAEVYIDRPVPVAKFASAGATLIRIIVVDVTLEFRK